MTTYLFNCPMTGLKVQAALPDDFIGPDTRVVSLDCPICRRQHLVHVKDVERDKEAER